MLEKNYSPLKSYCQSKLANVLFTKELAKRLEGINEHVDILRINKFFYNRQALEWSLFQFIRASFRRNWVAICTKPAASRMGQRNFWDATSSKRPRWAPRRPFIAPLKNRFWNIAAATSGELVCDCCKVKLSCNVHSFCSDCSKTKTARQGKDMEAAARLWQLSEKLVELD